MIFIITKAALPIVGRHYTVNAVDYCRELFSYRDLKTQEALEKKLDARKAGEKEGGKTFLDLIVEARDKETKLCSSIPLFVAYYSELYGLDENLLAQYNPKLDNSVAGGDRLTYISTLYDHSNLVPRKIQELPRQLLSLYSSSSTDYLGLYIGKQHSFAVNFYSGDELSSSDTGLHEYGHAFWQFMRTVMIPENRRRELVTDYIGNQYTKGSRNVPRILNMPHSGKLKRCMKSFFQDCAFTEVSPYVDKASLLAPQIDPEAISMKMAHKECKFISAEGRQELSIRLSDADLDGYNEYLELFGGNEEYALDVLVSDIEGKLVLVDECLENIFIPENTLDLSCVDVDKLFKSESCRLQMEGMALDSLEDVINTTQVSSEGGAVSLLGLNETRRLRLNYIFSGEEALVQSAVHKYNSTNDRELFEDKEMAYDLGDQLMTCAKRVQLERVPISSRVRQANLFEASRIRLENLDREINRHFDSLDDCYKSEDLKTLYGLSIELRLEVFKRSIQVKEYGGSSCVDYDAVLEYQDKLRSHLLEELCKTGVSFSRLDEIEELMTKQDKARLDMLKHGEGITFDGFEDMLGDDCSDLKASVKDLRNDIYAFQEQNVIIS